MQYIAVTVSQNLMLMYSCALISWAGVKMHGQVGSPPLPLPPLLPAVRVVLLWNATCQVRYADISVHALGPAYIYAWVGSIRHHIAIRLFLIAQHQEDHYMTQPQTIYKAA